MAKKRYLYKRQLEVLDDLFSGELDEQSVLKKHKVGRSVYSRWLEDKLFASEFSRRLESARFQGELIIARYSAVAAAKLVQLTESAKEETARKACLDIISQPKRAAKEQEQSSGPGNVTDEHVQQLSEQTTSRILAALAEERKG